MRRSLMIAAGLMAAALAGPAAAQHYGGYSSGYGSTRQSYNSGWDVRSQFDRPGDYRCDAYWDANRTDCGAGWRDQRRYSSNGYGYGNGNNPYGYSNNRYGNHGYGDNRGYSTRQRGYGSYGGSTPNGGSAYYGAYGRPDLVYPEGGRRSSRGGYSGSRDPRRIDWCRASYRSYDVSSGYYRAYSGRLIFCG